jgi:hypothetical protein
LKLEKCQNSNEKIQFYRRGIRNCPWIVKLWIDLALAMELGQEKSADIKSETFWQHARMLEGLDYFVFVDSQKSITSA